MKSKLTKPFYIYFLVIILIQIIALLVVMFGGKAAKNNKKEFSPSDFIHYNYQNVREEDDELVFYTSDTVNPDDRQTIFTKRFSLTSGCYEFKIAYKSDTNNDRNYQKGTAYLTIKSKDNELESDRLMLDDGHNEAVGRFWIPAFSEYDDVRIEIEYTGIGHLKVSEVEIAEKSSYRLIRTMGFIILFAVIDIIYYLLFIDNSASKKKVLTCFGAIIFIASIPFIGNTVYGGSDLWFHMTRIVSIAQGLSDGQFPVRMSTELNNGYGYANSLYYCDIFLYLPAWLYIMGAPLRSCYQLYVILVNIITGIFTYYAMSKFTKNQELMLVGTALYMFSAYRMVNMVTRAAAGEYTAMCFLPLIIAGVYKIIKSEEFKVSNWLPFSFGFAGIIMSHIVTLEMLLINLALVCLLLIYKFLNYRRILELIIATIIGCMLSAWFLIPFIDSTVNQTTFVQTEDLRMLGNSSMSWIGLLGLFASGESLGSSIALGMSLVVGFVLVAYCLISWIDEKNTNTVDFNSQISTLRYVTIVAVANLIMSSRLFPWNVMQNWFDTEKGLGYLLGTIQFAWRFLAIAVLLFSISIVIALDYLHERKKIYKISLIIIIATVVLESGFFYYGLNSYGNEEKWSNWMNYYASDELYLLEDTDLDIRKISACKTEQGVEIVDSYRRKDGKSILQVNNILDDTDVIVSLPIFAYNNYHAYKMHGKEKGTELELEKNEDNCLSVTIPAGYEGKVVVAYEEPIAWRVAEIVSLLTCLVLLGYFISKHINIRTLVRN